MYAAVHQIIELHSSFEESVVPWAALVAALTALLVAWSSRVTERQDSRRSLYSEAYKSALSWVEMLYRVRRRDPAKQHELVEQFHLLQERLDYHHGWIESESRSLGRSYRDLISTLKNATNDQIRQAWREDPCDPAEGFDVQADGLPGVAAAKDWFIADVRDHLTVLRFWRRIALHRRYRDQVWPSQPASPAEATSSGFDQKGGSS